MPTSWSNILSSVPESAELNRYLQQLTNFLPHDIAQDAFNTRIRNTTNIAFLALNSQRKVTILHHFSELGGTVVAPDVEVVCAVGLSARVTLMTPNLANCFETINLPAPNFTNMQGCDSVADLQGLRPPARAAPSQVKALLPLPPKLLPFLATAMQQHNSDPWQILLQLKNCYITLDANEADDAAKLSVHCENILRFLWVNATAQTVELREPTHPQVDNFYTECLQIIHPPIQPNNAGDPQLPVLRMIEMMESDQQQAQAVE